MAKIKPFFRFATDKMKEEFRDSRCLTTISVGQQTHENEHFESYIELINESFGSCVLLIDDSLQRHTMALCTKSETAESLYDISIEEGDLWLERNKKYYSKLTIPTQIFRWKKWLHHENFNSKQHSLKQEIVKDNEYKKALNYAILEFLTKHKMRLDCTAEFNEKRAYKLCYDFVLEECTAMSLWPELNCQFEVYPNLHNSAIEYTRKSQIHSKEPTLLRAATIGFRNAKQLKPQKFELLESALI